MNKPKVAYLGIPGSFSYAAANQLHGSDAEYLGVPSFSDVFGAVASGRADRGVIPIENSLAGSIYDNYDLLREWDAVSVDAETIVPVQHHLLVASPDTDISQITTVHSHPKALEQCKGLFMAYPAMERAMATDTATAAKFVGEARDPHLGAIASQQAADLYGLTVLKPNIQDDSRNFTRFVQITKEVVDNPDADKCSVILRLPHRPGSLHSALGVLAGMGCDLTKLESRPLVGTGSAKLEYVFHVDFTYDGVEEAGWTIDKVITELGSPEISDDIKVLGRYKHVPLPA